jgi:hypothetical protein
LLQKQIVARLAWLFTPLLTAVGENPNQSSTCLHWRSNCQNQPEEGKDGIPVPDFFSALQVEEGISLGYKKLYKAD